MKGTLAVDDLISDPCRNFLHGRAEVPEDVCEGRPVGRNGS